MKASKTEVAALTATLHRLASIEDIRVLLGITTEMPTEFWVTQKYTVAQRFFSYLLHKFQLPLATQREELTFEVCNELEEKARELLDKGLHYAIVREWWLVQGNYMHNRAYEARHEAERLASAATVVLVFFEGRRPLYLRYAEDGVVELKERREDAHQFTVYSLTELQSEHLEVAAKDFDVLVAMHGATHVKILPVKKA